MVENTIVIRDPKTSFYFDWSKDGDKNLMKA